MSSQWSYNQKWSPDATSVRECRRFVAGHLSSDEYAAIADDVSLVVSELATNVIRHARTPYCVTIQRSGGTVTVLVSDMSSRSPEPIQLSPRLTTGRGLMLVEALSHGWGVTTGRTVGKVVWAAFRVEPEPANRAGELSALRA